MAKQSLQKTPLPPALWQRGRQGRVVCQCGARVGSEFDGLCVTCRGGMTAYEAKLKTDLKGDLGQRGQMARQLVQTNGVHGARQAALKPTK